jgi:DNA-binding response OmpR family regulator
LKILIAEDDFAPRLLLEAILKKVGHEVASASNGKNAWQAMQGENPPMLAIVDWMMPEMNGLEFCRKVRESADLSSTYIILLTGKRQKEDFVTGLDSGADELVRKPFDREELLARVRSVERRIKLQSTLATQVKELEQKLSRNKDA